MNTKHIPYILIACLYAAEIGAAATHADRIASAPTIFWIAAALAVYHAARVISFSGVGEWIRAPFTHVVEDTSGAGDSVEPNPGNPIGELLACPICTGTHVAAALTLAYGFFPAFGLAAAILLGLAGAGQLFHWLAEMLEWQGRAAREQAGTEHLIKTRGSARAAYCDDPQPVPPREVIIRRVTSNHPVVTRRIAG